MIASYLLKTKHFSDSEIKGAVNIQIEEISQGFLSSLGMKPLTLIFNHAATSRFGILVIAKESNNGLIIGYILGSINTFKFYKDFLRSKTVPSLLYFIPKIISPRRIKKALETLIYPIKNGHSKVNESDAELLDMAVRSSYQSAGVGTELFKEFVKQCADKGVESFKIPTSESLKHAHSFYEKMGAKKAHTIEIHKGEQTYIYIYSLEG